MNGPFAQWLELQRANLGTSRWMGAAGVLKPISGLPGRGTRFKCRARKFNFMTRLDAIHKTGHHIQQDPQTRASASTGAWSWRSGLFDTATKISAKLGNWKISGAGPVSFNDRSDMASAPTATSRMLRT